MYYPPNQQGLVTTKNLLLSMDTQVGAMLIMQFGLLLTMMSGQLVAQSISEQIFVLWQPTVKEVQFVHLILIPQIGIFGMVDGLVQELVKYQLYAHKIKVRTIISISTADVDIYQCTHLTVGTLLQCSVPEGDLHCQCILSIFSASVHQFYANILVFIDINPLY